MFNTTHIHKASFVRAYKIARATGLKPKQAFTYAKSDTNLQTIKALKF